MCAIQVGASGVSLRNRRCKVKLPATQGSAEIPCYTTLSEASIMGQNVHPQFIFAASMYIHSTCPYFVYPFDQFEYLHLWISALKGGIALHIREFAIYNYGKSLEIASDVITKPAAPMKKVKVTRPPGTMGSVDGGRQVSE